MRSLCRTRECEERSTHTHTGGFLIASVEMLIIFASFILKCRARKTQPFDRLRSKKKKKQMSGFSDYKRLSLAGNNFKAAAFPQKARGYSERCDIPSLCRTIMVPCLKMTGVRMRPSLFLSTANRGHSLGFVFSVIAPFTKRRWN